MLVTHPRTWLVVGLLVAMLGGTLVAQQGGMNGPRNRDGKGNGNRKQEDPPKPVLPSDERLLEIHKHFVEEAMKLGAEYDRTGQPDKARVCYNEVLRLVPIYTPAQESLDKIRSKEATAGRKAIDVMANKGWQDTGITLIEGKPVKISADGSWNFRVSYDLGPDGIEIPKELRDFNLGSLVGVIEADKQEEVQPFFIGANKEFNAPKSGRLYLRMYDADPTDNTGKLSVTITGTFAK